MSASRWNTGPLEVFDWLQESDNSLEESVPALHFHASSRRKMSRKTNPSATTAAEEENIKYPDVLPILPLRGVVVYPQTAVPLTIGQPRSIKLVDDVSATQAKLVGLVAARNPEIEEPGPEDLYPVGTIATVHRLFRAPIIPSACWCRVWCASGWWNLCRRNPI